MHMFPATIQGNPRSHDARPRFQKNFGEDSINSGTFDGIQAVGIC